MTPSGAKRGVLVATAVTGVVAIVKAARAGELPRVSIGIGVVLSAAVLTALADAAPEAALGLAVLTTFTAAASSPQAITDVAGALSTRRQVTHRASSSGLDAGKSAGELLADESAGGGSASLISGGGGSAGGGGAITKQQAAAIVPTLVPIGQGGHKLAPAAAAAYQRACNNYGRQITVTDSFRSWDVQAAGYARDPHRFGSPGTSRHVRGEAIDVHTGVHNTRDPRLIDALRAAGWCQARPGDEPWHFSFNGCG